MTDGQRQEAEAAAARARLEAAEARAPELARELASTAQEACAAGDLSACRYFAFALEIGDGVPRDEASSVRLLTRGCEAKDALSCFALAQRLEGKRGPSQAEGEPPAGTTDARRYFTEGCALEQAESCRELVELRRLGLGGPVDEQGAKDALARFCALRPEATCPRWDELPPVQRGYLGRRSREEIQRALAEHGPELSACYELHRRGNPTLGGTITLSFWIHPTGATYDVHAGDETGSRELSSCVLQVGRRVRFPLEERGGRVYATYPVVFRVARETETRETETRETETREAGGS